MSRGNQPTEYLEHSGQPTDPPQPIATRQHSTKTSGPARPDQSQNATIERAPQGATDYGAGIDTDSDQ